MNELKRLRKKRKYYEKLNNKLKSECEKLQAEQEELKETLDYYSYIEKKDDNSIAGMLSRSKFQ